MSVPYIFGGGASPADNFSGTITLPANGGSIAIPCPLFGGFYPQTITCRTTDTSGSHTLEVALYADTEPLTRLIFGSFTFTATVAAVRTGVFTTSPVYYGGTGVIWLVCRNAGAASTTLSTFAASGLGGNYAATQTLGSSLASVLPTTGWTPTASLPLVRIDGSITAVGGATLN